MSNCEGCPHTWIVLIQSKSHHCRTWPSVNGHILVFLRRFGLPSNIKACFGGPLRPVPLPRSSRDISASLSSSSPVSSLSDDRDLSMSVLGSNSMRFDSSGTGAKFEPALALRLRCCVADTDGVTAEAACDDDVRCLRREVICGEDDEEDWSDEDGRGKPPETASDELESEKDGTCIPDGLDILKENVVDDGAVVDGVLSL